MTTVSFIPQEASQIDAVLSQIVNDQLQFGHFEVTSLIKSFISRFPRANFSKTRTACVLADYLNAILLDNQKSAIRVCDGLLMTVGTRANLIDLLAKALTQGMTSEDIDPSWTECYRAEMYASFGYWACQLLNGLQTPEDTMSEITDIYNNLTFQKVYLIAAHNKKYPDKPYGKSND